MDRRYLVGGLVVLVVALTVWALTAGSTGEPKREDTERDRAAQAEIQSALKNAATATETYAVDNNGDYSQADESDLIAMGLQLPEGVTFAGMEMEEGHYCFVLEHQLLPRDHPWRLASYTSDVGSPLPADDCP